MDGESPVNSLVNSPVNVDENSFTGESTSLALARL
jgi:hypothetical protein